MSLPLQTRVTRAVVLFALALYVAALPVVGGVLLRSLWNARAQTLRARLEAARQVVERELGMVDKDSQRLAGSLPLRSLRGADGPFLFIEPFTREMNRFDLDSAWIFRWEGASVRPWLDGARRLVLADSDDPMVREVCADLENRPWPQSGEGLGRTYFKEDSSLPGLLVLKAVPLYLDGSGFGWLLGGRYLSSHSFLWERLSAALSGPGFSGASFSLRHEGRELVRLGRRLPEDLWVDTRVAALPSSPLQVVIQEHRFEFVRTASLALLGLLGAFSAVTLGLLWGVRRVVRRMVDPALAEAARREEELRRRGLEAEIAALRAQMQPHFLFNTLNMIAQTIPVDGGQALEMTHALAELYRSVNDSALRVTHPLSEELRVVELYLRLQHFRFGERLRCTMDPVPARLHTLAIPCLIVQTIVENAVKHGISPLREGGDVRILISETNERVCIEVRNNGVRLPPRWCEGTGLRNSRRRWEACFGAGAFLEMCTLENGETSVRLECVP